MPTFIMSSSAWLSGWPGAGAYWAPTGRPNGYAGSANAANAADWQPTDPPGSQHSADWQPTDPPGSHHSTEWQPTDPPGARKSARAQYPTNSPWPWEGVYPTWTYAGSDAMLAQALRKSRAKIVRPADPRLTPKATGSLAPTPADMHPLWRWQSPFRVKTVAAELLSRFLAEQQTLWMLTPSSASGALTVQAEAVFAMAHPAAKFDLATQVDKVLRAAVEREDRLPEILSQASDLWPFFESICGISLASAPAAAELMAVAQEWALHLTMSLKHNVAAQRPWQCSALVMPVIATPGHGSLPSGHATMAAMISELLIALRGQDHRHERAVQLDRLARRIAFNRVVAGVHFPIDSQAGYRLGTQLGRLLAALAKAGHPTPAPIKADKVFEQQELLELDNRQGVDIGKLKLPDTPLFAELWRVASRELAVLGV